MILENKYINYIHRHQAGVLKSWKNILYPVLLTESDYDVELLTDIEILINCHDESKFNLTNKKSTLLKSKIPRFPER